MLSKPLLAASFEPLVLALLARGESYGCELIQQIDGLLDIHQLLARLWSSDVAEAT